MNLRTLDLNLLVILEALLEEAHVSRAAARVGLSQPATSSALERCRQIFDDPLLERSEGGMRLTSKAKSLREPLRDALRSLEKAIGATELPLAAVEQTVHVLMADILGALFAAPLFSRMQAEAPGLRLVLHPWGGGRNALAAAARGDVDLVVSVLPDADMRHFHAEDVLDEHYLVAMRDGHPAAEHFNLDAWLAWPHVVTTAGGEARGALDDVLAGMGLSRRTGLAVPSFMLVPDLLRETDLIGMVPSLCLAGRPCVGLVTREPPIPVPGFTLKLVWHRRRERDPAVRFVAGCLRTLLKETGRGPQSTG